MSDIRVVAVIEAEPGQADTVQAALVGLVAPTREEPGCVSYELFVSAVSPEVFITVETWRAQSDLDAHMQTPHIAAAIAAAGDAMAAAPAIHPLTPVG